MFFLLFSDYRLYNILVYPIIILRFPASCMGIFRQSNSEETDLASYSKWKFYDDTNLGQSGCNEKECSSGEGK